jgi:TonB family protein
LHLKRNIVTLCLLSGALSLCPTLLAAGPHSDPVTDHRTVLTRVAPVYPELAHRMGITGIVVVQVTIQPNGTVSDTRIESGHKLLAPAAEQAVHQWRFATAPDSTVMNIEIVFSATSH